MNQLSRSLKVAALASVLAALAGCATSGAPAAKDSAKASPAPASAPAAAPAPAPAPEPASGEGPSIAPTSDAGTLVFFRESKFMGAAVSFKVREGEQELGKLSNGTYFVAKVPPGAHAYTVHSEAKDVLNLEVEAGEVYYVQGSVSMGVMVGRPNLAPSNAAAFEALKPKLKDSAAPKTAKRR